MRLYPVQESELNTMSHLNTLSNIFFSIGSLCLSVSLSLWTGLLIEAGKGSVGGNDANTTERLCFIGAVLFYLAGSWSVYAKHSTISLIKKEASDG